MVSVVEQPVFFHNGWPCPKCGCMTEHKNVMGQEVCLTEGCGYKLGKPYEKQKAYYQRPDVKEKQKAYRERPDVKEKKKAYQRQRRIEKLEKKVEALKMEA